jgi:aromatic-L-amino-acid decarboxylase
MSENRRTTRAQHGLGDMEIEEFRAAARQVADRVADYLGGVEERRVLPTIEPGEVRAALPAEPPAAPQPLEQILEDYGRLIEPNVTHWQHPGFMAYFASTASGPGILGEWLATSLNSNVMFWRNAPASTELEEVVVDWLRRMLGLPDGFAGMFTDTASVSSLLSLVAARHAVPGLDSREHGLAGRELPGRLRMYTSDQSHMSIDKAAIVVGVGTAGVRKIPSDDDYRMRVDLLRRAIHEDRDAGWLPFCVSATLGTTSSTSVDPADGIADVCAEHGLWFHADAAYAGAAALAPEYRHHFAGWERADSIVFNPHKWLFTPFDASLLLFRRPDAFREAFSLVPEYLSASADEAVRNFNEYGVQLGRRFRALKLWFMIRWFGAEGLAARIREHCRLATLLAGWVDEHPDWERLAPVPFSTVCLRYRPRDLEEGSRLDELNERIMARINDGGRVYLSHTRLGDRFTIRVTLGNLRQNERWVRTCWDELNEAASACR